MSLKKIWLFVFLLLLIIGGGVSAYYIFAGGTNSSEVSDTVQNTEAAPVQTSNKNIIEVTSAQSSESKFVVLVKTTDINGTLQGQGPYTVLVPSNDAFEELSKSTYAFLSSPQNSTQLKNVLNYHIIPGKILASQFTNGQKIKTVNGQDLVVTVNEKEVTFTDAKGGKSTILKADIAASNGTVHVIDAVLLPQ